MRRLWILVALAGCGGDDDGGGGAIDAGREVDASGGGTDAGADAGSAADLAVRAEETADSIDIVEQEFDETSCELAEACIDGIGTRTLLRFDVGVVNQGAVAFELPGVEDAPWAYGACHDHYHLEGFSTYQLLDDEDTVVATTSYDAFCVNDFERVVTDGPDEAVYACGGAQGISIGWEWVVTGADIPCQWVDITDVAPGDYTLRVTTNVDRIAPESDFENNSVDVPVTIPP